MPNEPVPDAPANVVLHLGDARAILPTLPDHSVDAIVTDPPYELGIMGQSWDASGVATDVALWRECRRVLKPKGRLVLTVPDAYRYFRRLFTDKEQRAVLNRMFGVEGAGYLTEEELTGLLRRAGFQPAASTQISWTPRPSGAPAGSC